MSNTINDPSRANQYRVTQQPEFVNNGIDSSPKPHGRPQSASAALHASNLCDCLAYFCCCFCLCAICESDCNLCHGCDCDNCGDCGGCDCDACDC
ncbi:unnamed protein product [Adineta steineri]|uniref:Uncharacterized protein n=1 Tax=Adineta steineri TaxID=433720 RepID=A0A816DCY4_9BILA|nr:unnamed protein product [Adineta steineri]CAF1633253.1 unnamed protein product [Adineta steineri]